MSLKNLHSSQIFPLTILSGSFVGNIAWSSFIIAFWINECIPLSKQKVLTAIELTLWVNWYNIWYESNCDQSNSILLNFFFIYDHYYIQSLLSVLKVYHSISMNFIHEYNWSLIRFQSIFNSQFLIIGKIKSPSLIILCCRCCPLLLSISLWLESLVTICMVKHTAKSDSMYLKVHSKLV